MQKSNKVRTVLLGLVSLLGFGVQLQGQAPENLNECVVYPKLYEWPFSGYEIDFYYTYEPYYLLTDSLAAKISIVCDMVLLPNVGCTAMWRINDSLYFTAEVVSRRPKANFRHTDITLPHIDLKVYADEDSQYKARWEIEIPLDPISAWDFTTSIATSFLRSSCPALVFYHYFTRGDAYYFFDAARMELLCVGPFGLSLVLTTLNLDSKRILATELGVDYVFELETIEKVLE